MLVDVRERELLQHLTAERTGTGTATATAISKQLPVGDIWIGLSGETLAPGGLCIERKDVHDLEASLKDHRYREQRTRLLSLCQETRAKPVYILEGNLNSLRLTTPKQTLLKVLSRLSLRYNIPFFQTENIEETAKLLTMWEEQLREDPTIFQPHTVQYTEVLHSTSRKANRDDNIANAMLQQCSGVSATVATALLTHFKTFEALLHANEKDIASVKINDKRKVGPAIAKKLWTTFHDTPIA